jgi:F0F1-type ATP synthase membrane subunit c/vacuolar-type H+-ATPase subunit K
MEEFLVDRDQSGSATITVFVLSEDHILPGDILLTRPCFRLVDASTWKGQIIQRATGTSYSHAALCIGFAMFIEAIGPGVCRLAISQTGARDKENVRVL